MVDKLEKFKPYAIANGWLWVGTDMSEAASITEENMAVRLITDLSVATTALQVEVPQQFFGFGPQPEPAHVPMDFDVLHDIYRQTPGLITDKLKNVLEVAARALDPVGRGRVIFACDEAQNLADHADRDEFPLSVLLDVFQSIQRKGIPFMLLLTGLPTLLTKLVDARTYAERMFRVLQLDRLNEPEQREAILRPIEEANCPVKFNEESVNLICGKSGGYPYFIQFICREVFDVFIQQMESGVPAPSVPIEAIQLKLDTDCFTGRWARVTDRQRHLLWVIFQLERADDEFAIQDVVKRGKELLSKSFSSSHANQMLANLAEQGLIYKNRHGPYSFAVPLAGGLHPKDYVPPRSHCCRHSDREPRPARVGPALPRGRRGRREMNVVRALPGWDWRVKSPRWLGGSRCGGPARMGPRG